MRRCPIEIAAARSHRKLLPVPAIGAEVRPNVARHVRDQERSRVTVKQLLCVAEPILCAAIQRGPELFAVAILVQDPAKNLVHPGVLDHVGIDEVVPAKKPRRHSPCRRRRARNKAK